MNALIRYTALLVWGVLVLSSCTRELRGGSEPLSEGTPITMSFEAAVPDDELSLRSSSEATSLWLLVFDENHRYLYRSKAVVVTNANVHPNQVRPDNGKEPSGGKNKFTVTLLASSKKRYIHFISNYDFSEEGPNHFKPDHQLLKIDEGQIIPRLFTEDKGEQVAKKVYWRVFDFDGLNESSFQGVDFRLLRNRARIKVTSKEGINFDFKGFCIHNAPNKGTVASYYAKDAGTPGVGDAVRPMYQEVAYCFPTFPQRATLMGGYELQKKLARLGYKDGGLDNKEFIEVYEYDNNMSEIESAGGTKETMFVIVYGQLNGTTRPGYYKLDLAKILEADGHALGKYLTAVIRNNSYVISIEEVHGEGAVTYDEAVRQPASNNIFASVELKEYGGVSDGKYNLVVENTDAMMLLPGQFSAGISFFSATGILNKNVEVFLLDADGKNGKLCKGKIDPNDSFVEYANYNGDLGRLYVNVKQIPPNNKVYKFKVVGKKDKSIMERTITLTLRPRFQFKAELKEHNPYDNPQTERVDLTFTVPGALPKTLFPYKVRVAADYLSPYVGAEVNDGMKVVSEGTRVYYEYLVKTPTNGTDRRETIHFQRSRTDKSCVVTLMSDYYVNDDVLLKEKASIDKDDRVPLLFKGLSYTTPRWVPSDYRTKLEGSPSYIADVKMVTAGYMEFSDYTHYESYLNEDYTVTAKVKEAGGSVTSKKTMKVQEWVNLMQNSNAQAILDIEEVEIEGEIYYKDWLTHPNEFKTRGAQPVPAGTSGFTFSNNLGRSGVNYDLQITSEGKFKMKVSGLKGINETMAIKVGHSGIAGTGHLESYALYLGSLLDIPTIYINEHKDGD